VAAIVDAQDASIPDQLGKHRVIAKLATGGMATVYLARLSGPGGFENLVVIKRMLPHLAEDPRFRDMFVDEARTVAQLRHPNVVRTFELFEEGKEVLLVMEYLEGEPLQRLARAMSSQQQRLSIPIVCYIAAEAAAGLNAAHELTDEDGRPLGIVHRDVSPQNLFVGYDGSVKVIDFGIAKSIDRTNHTTTGEIKGKFAYMSPEHASAAPVTRKTDIFALGVILWELLTGRRLFARPNQMSTLRAVADELTPPPSEIVPGLPPELDAICARCLAKDPAERYETMADLRRDLTAVMRAHASGDPQSELALWMQQLFEKSITDRRMLVRASRERTVSAIARPPAPSSETAANSERPTALARVPGSRRVVLAIGAVLGVVLIAAFGYHALGSTASSTALAEPSARSPSDSTAVSATDPTASGPAVPAAPVPSTAAPTPARVAISIASDPDGALVVIDGIARGNTPVVVELPEGASPLTLELTLTGRRTASTRFVPDHPQTLRLALPRAGRAPASSAAAHDEHGAGGFFAFE